MVRSTANTDNIECDRSSSVRPKVIVRMEREPRFLPGELVMVRPLEEILQMLDKNGCLDGLPFMPEMVEYCGRTFRVNCKVEKACVDGRRMFMGELVRNDVYFLEDLRCSGLAHGGCQIGRAHV